MPSDGIDIRLADGAVSRYDGDAYATLTDHDVTVVYAAYHADVGEIGVATILTPVPASGLPASVERIHGLGYHDAPAGTSLHAWLEAYAEDHVGDLEAAHHAFDIPTPDSPVATGGDSS